MENRAITGRPDTINDLRSGINRDIEISFPEVNQTNPVWEKMTEEGCEDFFSYIVRLGLDNDPNLIILPSTHHYFYDIEDLKEVRTVVNMKQLNYIKQIKDFMHNLYHILSHQSYFVGRFIERDYQNGFYSGMILNWHHINGNVDPVENGIESRIPFLNMMYNIMDSRTNRHLTKRTVTLLLGDAGFKVLDMTGLDGLTYFCAQKVKSSLE
jgi:hypothetical protein